MTESVNLRVAFPFLNVDFGNVAALQLYELNSCSVLSIGNLDFFDFRLWDYPVRGCFEGINYQLSVS